jgi:hypothetical protein
MDIQIRIDELILEGLSVQDPTLIHRAVELELARLIAADGLPLHFNQNESIAQLDGGAYDVSPTAGSDSIGTQVAQAIYGGVK